MDDCLNAAIKTQDERSKFEALYCSYKGLMYHAAYDILNCEQDAEEAVHVAFCNSVENIWKIDDVASEHTKGYLLTLVEAACINICRAKGQQMNFFCVGGSAKDDIMGHQTKCTDECVESDGLERCTARLLPRYRMVLILRYRYGYGYREMAKMLNLSESNLKSLLQKARTMLLQLCKEEGLM